MKITYARSGMVGPALQSRMRDAHKYRAPLGWAGLGIWWRQVIESCYHQGSDSGVGVCRISGPPASGVVEGKSQDAGVLSVRVASLAMNLGSGCPAHPWRLQLLAEAGTAAWGSRRVASHRVAPVVRRLAEGF